MLAQKLAAWPPTTQIPENTGVAPRSAFLPKKLTIGIQSPEIFQYGPPGTNHLLVAVENNKILWQKTIGSKGRIVATCSPNGKIIALLTDYPYKNADLHSPSIKNQNQLFLLEADTGKILFEANVAQLLNVPLAYQTSLLDINIAFSSQGIAISTTIQGTTYQKNLASPPTNKAQTPAPPSKPNSGKITW
jgi:hypothetical protein